MLTLYIRPFSDLVISDPFVIGPMYRPPPVVSVAIIPRGPLPQNSYVTQLPHSVLRAIYLYGHYSDYYYYFHGYP